MKTRLTLIAAVLFASATVALATPKSVTDFGASDFSVTDIVRALSAPRTRGLSIGTEEADEASGRKISMALRFARNSAELTAEAKRRLDVVGAALTGAELAQSSL